MCTDEEDDDVEVKDEKKVGVSLLVHALAAVRHGGPHLVAPYTHLCKTLINCTSNIY
jgi:hypothetical protein